jgi:O-antigen/teichoic acid export membrane protein
MSAPEPTSTDGEQEPAAEEDLGTRAGRSTVWAILGFGGGQGLRFIGNLILTRLLFEEAFGMMAIVNVLMQGLELFSDVGIGPSIIQNERGDDPRFLNTAWTIQIGRGFLLLLFATAIGWPAAQFYGEPQLMVLLPLVGISAVFNGFMSTKYFTVSRHLDQRSVTIMNVGAQAFGLTVMVTWGLVSPTLYALVAGALATPFAKLILSHVLLPGMRNRLTWDASAARGLFSFGRWIFLSTLLGFMTSHADRLIFGKLVPLNLLGIYSIGSMLAVMPAIGVGHLSFSVTFPLYSRVRDLGVPLLPIIRRVRFPFLLLGAWSLSGMIGGGQVAIDLLYDERYAAAGWIVQMLSVMSWLMIMVDTNHAALLATGAAQWGVWAGLGKLLGMLVFITLGFQHYGFEGGVAGYVLADGAKLLVIVIGTIKERISDRLPELGLTVLGAISSAACYGAAQAARAAGLHSSLQALAVFLTASIVFSVVFIPYGLRVRREGSPLRVKLPEDSATAGNEPVAEEAAS